MSIESWLEQMGIPKEALVPLDGDASARRYYRLNDGIQKAIVMDSSQMLESFEQFLFQSDLLTLHGIKSPKVIAYDKHLGYGIIEDLGSTHLGDIKQPEAKEYYMRAVDLLLRLSSVASDELLSYDEAFMIEEMALFDEWFLPYVEIEPPKEATQEIYTKIAQTVASQPMKHYVHRDFHSFNIMIDKNNALSLIDFQDARCGMLCYDLISLTRDIYAALDKSEIEMLEQRFFDGLSGGYTKEEFELWCDYTALQRYLKILGIFVRLSRRDGKTRYLKYLPQLLTQSSEIAAKYQELEPLLDLLNQAQKALVS